MFTRASLSIVIGFTLLGLVFPIFYLVVGGGGVDLNEDLALVLNGIGWLLWPTWFLTYLGLAVVGQEPMEYLDAIVVIANALFWFAIGLSVAWSSSYTGIKKWIVPFVNYVVLFLSFNFLFLCYFEQCPLM